MLLPSGVETVFTAYVGLQSRGLETSADVTQLQKQGVDHVQSWIESTNGPSAHEFFHVIDGNDSKNTVTWACYWTDKEKFEQSMSLLSLRSLYLNLAAAGQKDIGLWLERFKTPFTRLETNYSGLDYLPGLGRLPDTSTTEHELTGYWGAARDRIPNSADDLFAPERKRIITPDQSPRGLGQRIYGSNKHNTVHIRSGQLWENCDPQEADAYEEKLEPTLVKGLEYLWQNPVETGTLAIRYLRNADEGTMPSTATRWRRETCGAGFFTSLESLESWAKSHPSHLAIWRGALSHFKAFGENRKLRTWHEVSVLQAGDAEFEYINCEPGTGVMLTDDGLSVEDI